VITARALARTFQTKTGPVEAVRGIDLDVAAGEIVGFLGPNGAGKTTTLRMLTTLLSPTSGEAAIAGCDLRRDPVGVRRQIGYVAQGGAAYPEAVAGEEVVDQARLYGIPAARAREQGRKLFAQLDLDGLWTRTCKSLSGGQRRRLDIALGLVHSPTLVFLDEPSTGLDPQSRANLWQHIRRLRDEMGTTVFLTTHYLDEADALCDRVLVIDHGTIVAAGSPDELKRSVNGDAVLLTLADRDRVESTRPIVQALVAADAGADAVTVDRDRDQVQVRVPHGASVLPGLLRELDAQGVTLAEVEVRRPTLDDVFLSVTGRSLRDDTSVA
jgi:ABC-2 type transport system ATP-binding protein